MTKKFYASKTFWFGALWILVGAASVAGYADFVPSDDVTQIASIVNGVVIILLRYVTDTKVTL